MRETPEEIIARVGWMVQYVMAGSTSLPFTYTIGLSAKDLPELFVFTLPPQVAQPVLNDLARRMASGETLPLDTPLINVLQDFPVYLKEVPREQADQYMFQALYRYPHYRALQLVWPDPAGRFPWQPGYNATGCPQPLLLGPVQ